jgi:hypothetical protein
MGIFPSTAKLWEDPKYDQVIVKDRDQEVGGTFHEHLPNVNKKICSTKRPYSCAGFSIPSPAELNREGLFHPA